MDMAGLPLSSVKLGTSSNCNFTVPRLPTRTILPSFPPRTTISDILLGSTERFRTRIITLYSSFRTSPPDRSRFALEMALLMSLRVKPYLNRFCSETSIDNSVFGNPLICIWLINPEAIKSSSI